MYNLDLAPVVFAVKIWRYYLYGEKFDLFSDHKCFKYIFSQNKMNMTQWRWIELLKDYNFSLKYNPGKANVIDDALSQKPCNLMASLMIREWRVWEMIAEFDFQPLNSEEGWYCGCIVVQLTIISRILEAQKMDKGFQ